MKKWILYYQLILILSIIALQLGSYAQTPYDQPKNWKLVFKDDFNKKLDLEVWNVRNNWDFGGKPMMYTSREKNVRVENGSLLIECQKENYRGHEYTSGYLQLKEDYKYGFFEIRCKMPLGKGLWPAFWFAIAQSTKDGWPPEIDVFEMDGNREYFRSGGIFAKVNGEPKKTFKFKDNQFSIQEWHKYALEWDENVIHWYVDNKLVATATNDIPHILRSVALNMAIFSWKGPPADANYFPAKYEIDYIKIWKRTDGCPKLSWKEKWISSQATEIDQWMLKANDQLVVGDFKGDGKDEILMINRFSKKAGLFEFEKGEWKQGYSNGRSKKISNWNIHSKDQYVSADFDGDGRDEILLVNYSHEKIQLLRFKNNRWMLEFSNSNDHIGEWIARKNDHFLVGDFNQNGKQELLIINSSTKKVQMLSYSKDRSGFEFVRGGSFIPEWTIDADDQYIIGDYYNDGQQEIIFINARTKKVKLYYFQNGKWHYDYHNKASGAISSWKLNSDDIYISGDFDQNGTDDILFINQRTKHTRIYHPSNWESYWSNHGNLNIYDWNIHIDLKDKMLSGQFEANSPSQIFIIRHSDTENINFTEYHNTFMAKSYVFLQCSTLKFKPKEKPWKLSKPENPSGIIRVKH